MVSNIPQNYQRYAELIFILQKATTASSWLVDDSIETTCLSDSVHLSQYH